MLGIRDDLMAPEVLTDPYSYYGRLREVDPVHWNLRWKGWLITRYEEVVRIFRDHEHFSSERMTALHGELSEADRERFSLILEVLSRWFVFRDPPFHTRLRMLTNKYFTPKAVERWRPLVRSIVLDLLERAERKGGMDAVWDFGFIIPVSVIADILGVPQQDRDHIKEWSDKLGQLFFIRANDPKRRETAYEGLKALVEYMEALVRERRARPRDDFISTLLTLQGPEGVFPEEVVPTCILLLFAGHETTTNLIANGTLALLRHPDQWERLRQEPGLAPTAVEELLRYDGPVKATMRWAKEDAEIGGKRVRKGDRMLLVLAAANRDPAQFPNPEALDLSRSPNHHVAFGHGIHMCLGANLARQEGQEAFLALTQRFPGLRLATDRLNYQPTIVARALQSLPVAF